MLRNSVKSVTLFLQQDQPYNRKQNIRTIRLYETIWRHIYLTSVAIIYGFISHIKSTEYFYLVCIMKNWSTWVVETLS